jgi:hypothetical protein
MFYLTPCSMEGVCPFLGIASDRRELGQPEMERGRSPLASIPLFGRGFF